MFVCVKDQVRELLAHDVTSIQVISSTDTGWSNKKFMM